MCILRHQVFGFCVVLCVLCERLATFDFFLVMGHGDDDSILFFLAQYFRVCFFRKRRARVKLGIRAK